MNGGPILSRVNEPRAWPSAFKQVLYFARMSRKARRGASPSSSGRSRKRHGQRCAVRVIYSQNKTHGQWKAHGRYLMRAAATSLPMRVHEFLLCVMQSGGTPRVCALLPASFQRRIPQCAFSRDATLPLMSWLRLGGDINYNHRSVVKLLCPN
jgi:hypothetical protein